jgi:hypothetical protein
VRLDKAQRRAMRTARNAAAVAAIVREAGR